MAELPDWELGGLWTLALAPENKTHAEGKFPTDPDDYFVLKEMYFFKTWDIIGKSVQESREFIKLSPAVACVPKVTRLYVVPPSILILRIRVTV